MLKTLTLKYELIVVGTSILVNVSQAVTKVGSY
jgi:hypothetical protein